MSPGLQRNLDVDLVTPESSEAAKAVQLGITPRRCPRWRSGTLPSRWAVHGRPSRAQAVVLMVATAGQDVRV